MLLYYYLILRKMSAVPKIEIKKLDEDSMEFVLTNTDIRYDFRAFSLHRLNSEALRMRYDES